MKKLKWPISIVALLVVVHVVIKTTGNGHLYKTLANTVLKGRLGPSIDEYTIYPNRKVDIATPTPWQINPSNKEIDQKYLSQMEELESAAFLVIQDKKIVYEKYWEEYSPKSYTNSWSMAKSFVSVAVGAAIKDGKIESVNQKVGDFLPEFTKGKNKDVTIKHLLTMTSGIEFGENYKSPFGFMAKTLYGENIRELTLKYNVSYPPGKYFHYQGGNTLLLSFVLEMATGKKLSEYFSEKIWQPIGAEQPAYWSLDSKNGYEKAFCCFNSNARDFARVGQLYLDTGKWNGEQLVGKYYVLNSVKPIKALNKEDNTRVMHYGYSWWLANYNNMEIFFARGIQGQYIICVPEKNAVIVRLGHKRSKEKKDHHPADFYMYIDAAMQVLK